ncbi:hypothetical protein SSBR45G_46210 [Bradyrhizobium sp. SSBR45G]|uniref:hypothetical protein n=1 Tax=unclassified Bradyrhizobium TaxID=2631580 RepID=UPI0023429D1C|nr:MULTISPECIES: hypothetical protein [unclassified Bradyrhizobium]GLH79712.1 hypothetical protein SSBR45G_46210 [Bradyrhizobium sp. SSBR45G]GLH87170.1 hypothetical protein SSBR45R_46300 [Bradyrhizobium sp. SSBR45R]
MLNWQDRGRLVWVRGFFDGSGLFNWLCLCPPNQFEDPPAEDYKNAPVNRGAPASLLARIDYVRRKPSNFWTISFEECDESTPGAIKIITAGGETFWGRQVA